MTDTTGKITQAELKSWFGDKMPPEVMKLLFEAPEGMSIGEIRTKVRAMAYDVTNPDYLLEEADKMLEWYLNTENVGTIQEEKIALWRSRLGVHKFRQHEAKRDVLGLEP